MTHKQQAQKYIKGYITVGSTVLSGYVLPGATSVGLGLIELAMCCQIGQIYHGRSYSWHAARIAAGVIGIMSSSGR